MAREFAEHFYKSKTWQKCRASYIKSVGGLCEECLSKGIIKPGVIVHHMIVLNESNINEPSITLDWNNLKYVCRECHAQEHSVNKRRRYTINDDGSINFK